MAISVWEERAERAKASLARLREHADDQVPKLVGDAIAIGAGGIAGAVRGAFEATGKSYAIPGPGGMKIPPEVPLGALAIAVAVSGKTKVSKELHAFAAGLLAYSAGREAENYMRLRQKSAAVPPGTVQ